jgi:hypothetical protein
VPTDPWTAAGITLLGVTVGAFITGSVTQYREARKERQHRGRVATALLCEVMGRLDVAITCASVANLAEHGLPPGHGMKPSQITQWLPPAPTVYRSLASQLPLLSPLAVSATIAFHASVEWANSLSQSADGEALTPDQAAALGNAWRSVALKGLQAMSALLQHSSAPRSDADNEHITLLKADAGVVRNHEWPRVKYNEATHAMEIGSRWAR